MASKGDFLPHFYLGSGGEAKKYTYPNPVVDKTEVPPRDRPTHAGELFEQIRQVRLKEEKVKAESENYELATPLCLQVSFESFPGIEMAFESLADARQNIELLNVHQYKDVVSATLLVPIGKLSVIEKKIEAYRAERKDKNGSPLDNRKLIDALQTVRDAAFEELWTDDINILPDDPDLELWWEVWLPIMNDRAGVINDFSVVAKAMGIVVSKSVLEFPERSVLLVKTSRNSMASSALLLSKVAEIRKPKETAEFFHYLDGPSQAEWSQDLLSRLEPSSDSCPYICILDSGVNSGHPLLSSFIGEDDQYTVNPEWDASDDEGHGTGMTGLSVWGDLAELLDANDQLSITHRLESVKLVRYSGDNDGKHHGIITAEGVSLPYIDQPGRTRVFLMALTASDFRDYGKPSAWSAELDSLTSDYLGENENLKLMVVSGGNTGSDLTDLKGYPTYNEAQSVHDPGQSWNALTVGGYTNKASIKEDDAQHFSTLAPWGGLSPYSTTSVLWDSSTPIKPDVVFEAGNVGEDRYGCAGISSLKLLTTHNEFNIKHFSTFEGTSAASALAAKFSAEILALYPKLWPESVRGLVVHSADWSPAMRQQFSAADKTGRQMAQHLVRCVGYGIPDRHRALWSAKNSLAMIIEDFIQPFEKKQGKSASTKDMHVHNLPWPKEKLLDLGEADVKMTVTLSYFVEPNPSSRNVSSKYRYPSCQLRFDVKRPTEEIGDFEGKVSKASARKGGSKKRPADPNWLLGDFRNKGSIHKDIWHGTAADLAERGCLIVYPAMGWWRTRTNLGSYNKKIRYSLIVSIEVPKVKVDLYTDIATHLGATVKSEIALDSGS